MATAGRPTTYTPETANAILAAIEAGYSVNASCLAEGVKPSTFREWVKADRDGISAQYARARGIGLKRIWDHGHHGEGSAVTWSKFLLERMDEDLRPPRQEVEHSGNVAVTLAELLHADTPDEGTDA